MDAAEQLEVKLAERIRKVTNGPVAVTRREVLAAQIKVMSDRKLGRRTPQWIAHLADLPLHTAKPRPRRAKRVATTIDDTQAEG